MRYQLLTHIAYHSNDKTKITAIIAQSTVDDCLLQEELEKLNEDERLDVNLEVLMENKNGIDFEIHFTVSRPNDVWKMKGGRYHCGRINADMFHEVFGDFEEGRIAGYCGPPKFEKTCKQLFADCKYPRINMHRW